MNDENNKIFEPLELTKDDFEEESKTDLNNLHATTYAELTSQQTKRDEVIKIYLTLLAFAVPISLTLNDGWLIKGIIFFALGLIGILFSIIIIRYRIYKEAYWLACRTIAILQKAKRPRLNKKFIQTVYFFCIQKNAKSYFNAEKKKIIISKFIKKTLFSAETIYLIIAALVSGSLFGFGCGCLLYENIGFSSNNLLFSALIGAGIGILAFFFLVFSFMKHLYNINKVLEKREDKYFNLSFGKAWTLHAYYDKNN